MAAASDVVDASLLRVTLDPAYDSDGSHSSSPRGGSSGSRSGGDEEGSLPVPSPSSLLSRGQRLTLGIVVLILVEVIWVASSELTEVLLVLFKLLLLSNLNMIKFQLKELLCYFQYIFHEEKFDKPFFSTYVKTSMFLIFLLGFLCWTPWHERCRKQAAHHYTVR
jgi:solute carrier family 35 protein F5